MNKEISGGGRVGEALALGARPGGIVTHSPDKMLEIILNSTSIANASEKIFGYCNKKSTNIIKEVLMLNSIDPDSFKKTKSKYIFVDKLCPVCNKIFLTKNDTKEKITCSVSCSNSFRPKRKISTYKKCKNKPKKVEKNKICTECNKEFKTYGRPNFCSKECRITNISKRISIRIENKEHNSWISRNTISFPEKYFMSVLKQYDIGYKYNLPVSHKELGLSTKSYYALDFYIEKNTTKIDLEIDGKQHEYEGRKTSDSIRDSALKKAGFLVYRIKWPGCRNKKSKDLLIKQIEDFINWYKNIL